jgi:hypothetical protein
MGLLIVGWGIGILEVTVMKEGNIFKNSLNWQVTPYNDTPY